MLQKVARILKVRWPEAVMLIGLFAGLSSLTARISQEFYTMDTMIDRLPFWSAFGMGAGLMALSILLGMLFMGFLRSSALDPLIPRRPLDLMQIGRPYFWKLFLPYLVFELVWTLLALLLLTLLHYLIYKKPPAEQIPDWLLRLCQLLALAVLIKPFLLMPNLVILQDIPLPAAFVQCRGFAMRKMKNLMKILQLGYLLIFAVFGLLFILPFPKPFFWIRIGIFSIVSGSVFLVFFLTAMLEISQRIQPETQETP